MQRIHRKTGLSLVHHVQRGLYISCVCCCHDSVNALFFIGVNTALIDTDILSSIAPKCFSCVSIPVLKLLSIETEVY